MRFQQLALFKPLIDFVLVIHTLILFGIRGGKDYYHDEDDYVDIESE